MCMAVSVIGYKGGLAFRVLRVSERHSGCFSQAPAEGDEAHWALLVGCVFSCPVLPYRIREALH